MVHEVNNIRKNILQLFFCTTVYLVGDTLVALPFWYIFVYGLGPKTHACMVFDIHPINDVPASVMAILL